MAESQTHVERVKSYAVRKPILLAFATYIRDENDQYKEHNGTTGIFLSTAERAFVDRAISETELP